MIMAIHVDEQGNLFTKHPETGSSVCFKEKVPGKYFNVNHLRNDIFIAGMENKLLFLLTISRNNSANCCRIDYNDRGEVAGRVHISLEEMQQILMSSSDNLPAIISAVSLQYDTLVNKFKTQKCLPKVEDYALKSFGAYSQYRFESQAVELEIKEAVIDSPVVANTFPYLQKSIIKQWPLLAKDMVAKNYLSQQDVDFWESEYKKFDSQYRDRADRFAVDQATAYQNWINSTEYAISGAHFLYDPQSGKLLRSSATLVHEQCIISNVISFFEGADDLYLVFGAGGWANCFYFLYSVKYDLRIDIDPSRVNHWSWGKKNPQANCELIRTLLGPIPAIAGRMAPNESPKTESPAFFSTLLPELVEDTFTPKTPGAISKVTASFHITGTRNLGHLLWNELGGLNDALKYVRRRGESSVVHCQSMKYVDQLNLNEVFRNDDAKFVKSENQLQWVPRSAKPLSLHMSTQLIDKLIDGTAKKANSYFVKKVMELRKSHIVVWLNVRNHNKRLSNLAEYVEAIKKAITEIAGLPFFFLVDGMPDCEEILKEIFADESAEQFLLLAGENLSTVVSLCLLSDFYTGPVGSGIVIPTWVSGLPGLAHGDRVHLGQRRFWADVSDNYHRQSVFCSDEMIEGAGTMYSDYMLDIDAAIKLLIPIITEVAENRCSAQPTRKLVQ